MFEHSCHDVFLHAHTFYCMLPRPSWSVENRALHYGRYYRWGSGCVCRCIFSSLFRFIWQLTARLLSWGADQLHCDASNHRSQSFISQAAKLTWNNKESVFQACFALLGPHVQRSATMFTWESWFDWSEPGKNEQRVLLLTFVYSCQGLSHNMNVWHRGNVISLLPLFSAIMSWKQSLLLEFFVNINILFRCTQVHTWEAVKLAPQDIHYCCFHVLKKWALHWFEANTVTLKMLQRKFKIKNEWKKLASLGFDVLCYGSNEFFFSHMLAHPMKCLWEQSILLEQLYWYDLIRTRSVDCN